MSRLHDLLRQLEKDDAKLAADLRTEFDALADRRSFGLNFERHVPEAVELPGRPVRRGEKVRVLPARGEKRTAEHDRLWRVTGITKDGTDRIASLMALDDAESAYTSSVAELVVVSEFRDPIYPGLVATGKVERGGDKPFHTVINAENFHALQALLFTHRGKVDCIYIDPPYNTGAKDWKYDNDYVEGDDVYRHSKWLAMMERRLLLAKELLNPEDSVLIVTIDEKEYLRLGMLLEQTFPDAANSQMVSSVINPKGSSRRGAFSRTDEYLFVVFIGAGAIEPTGNDMTLREQKANESVRWAGLMRQGANGRRSARPNLFYPIFVDDDTGRIHSIGDALAASDSRFDVEPPKGTTAIWPIAQNGGESTWGRQAESLRDFLDLGYVKVGRFTPGNERCGMQHLQSGQVAAIRDGELLIVGHEENGAVRLEWKDGPNATMPTTAWHQVSHSASEYGSSLLRSLLPGRAFPFPKSVYAVEDMLRFVVKTKPAATIVDFFSGSGTTAHAVMRLNKQDGGCRQAILVTNNEVSADEQKTLRERGLRPGDPEWEALGICDFITKPRIEAAITGKTPDGEPIKGDYKFTDEFPMADGFEENAEFFTLTYESAFQIKAGRAFSHVAPLLWMRAGSEGRRIEALPNGWDVAHTYGVLANLDRTTEFLEALAANERASVAFIVTDEDRLFETIVAELPSHVEPVRLYDAYVRNFEIEAGRLAR